MTLIGFLCRNCPVSQWHNVLMDFSLPEPQYLFHGA